MKLDETPATPLVTALAGFYFKMTLNELNDPKEPENIICTMVMYVETFYNTTTAAEKINKLFRTKEYIKQMKTADSI